MPTHAEVLNAIRAKHAKKKSGSSRGLKALTALLALTAGAAHVKRTGNARAANARAANARAVNFRKGLTPKGTHHIALPGPGIHSITKPVYQAANNKYYIHTGNGTGNIAGYTMVTKNTNALPGHRNWYKA